MDRLSQISLENTVTVKIDYLLNQQLLVKNFGIIMDCLKDLKTEQDRHGESLKDFAGLRDVVDKLREEFRLREEKDNNNSNNNINNSSEKVINNNDSSQIDKANIQNFQKQLNQLKNRTTANESSIHENTKDINILLKDMKDAKQEIQNLKKQLSSINTNNSLGQIHSEKNLGKNDSLSGDLLNKLNQQVLQHQRLLERLEREMDEVRGRVKSLERDVDGLKNVNEQLAEDKKLMESSQNNSLNNNNTDNNNNNGSNIDQSQLSQILKKIDFLTKKSQNLQSQLSNNTRSISELNQTTDKNIQEIDLLKDDVTGVNKQIERINQLLEGLEKRLSGMGSNNNGGNTNNNSNGHTNNGKSKNTSIHDNNNNNTHLLNQIEKLKDQYERLLKIVNSLKSSSSSKSSLQHNDNNNQTDRLPTSNKNITKISQQRSFRKRSQSVDVNGKIRDLTQRIKVLEKLSGDDNPQKLPSIGWKKPNQTGYNGQKSHKKQMSQMKNDLQIWVKSYLDSMSKNNGGNLTDLQLKIQQMRNTLQRKADHQGMKKGLAFLQEPQSEDAMIVRKGFNCLSCSKKVQNLRGKLGPRMNWDNLNTTHNNVHTPPKTGFPKYNDSNEKQSI